MNVLITNQCATNKGDRAVLYCLIRELLRNGIKDITVSTSNPYYWRNFNFFPDVKVRFIRFGWSVCSQRPKPEKLVDKVIRHARGKLYKKFWFPLVRRALLSDRCPWYIRFLCTNEYWEALGRADLVIGTGGHRVTTLLVKDAVFPATFDMAVALLRKKRLVLWSQTIGPLEFKRTVNRRLIQKLLSNASRILIRDENSKSEFRAMNVSLDRVFKTRDTVFALFDLVRPSKPSNRDRILGISVYTTAKRNPEEKKAYRTSFSKVVNYAAEQGYKVRFFPMQLEGSDMPCIKDIIKGSKHKEVCSIVGSIETPEHIKQVAECQIFIGHKTHSIVFALTTATPVVAVAYHKKSEDFMTQFGLGEYCLPDAYLSGRKLIEVFKKVELNLDTIGVKEVKHACEIGARVQQDFARMIDEFRNGYM